MRADEERGSSETREPNKSELYGERNGERNGESNGEHNGELRSPEFATDDGEEPFAHASAAEAELARRLEEGPLEADDPEAEAVARLSPRWEIRVQTERDPVAEETALYSKLAKEADGRYGEDK